MLRYLVICIGILAGCAQGDGSYSKYKDCQTTTSDKSCYTGNSVFNSWNRSDINIFSNTENLCRSKSKYIELIYCKYNNQSQCFPDDKTKELYVTAAAEEKAVDSICSSSKSMNFTCLKESEQELGDCQKKVNFKQLNQNTTFEEWKNQRCGIITLTYNCSKESNTLQSCPETRSLYLEYSRITYPVACGTLSTTQTDNNGSPPISAGLFLFFQIFLVHPFIFLYH